MKGIYQIYNIKNHKSYIGMSARIANRWYNHKQELRKNVHKNTHLQAAWNKYGEKEFIFRILEEVAENTTREDLVKLEDYYIKEYDSLNPEKGYNFVVSDSSLVVKILKNRKVNKYKFNEEKYAKLDFYKKHEFLQGNLEKRELILMSIQKYLSEGYSIRMKCRWDTLNIYVYEGMNLFKKVSFDKNTLVLLESSKSQTKSILEIKPGTSTIINKWNTPKKLMCTYIHIEYTRLGNVLLLNKKKSSSEFYALQNHIFIREEDYNPDLVYETKWEANKKVKALKPKQVFSKIEELDSQGVVLFTYSRRAEVLSKYPEIKAKAIDKVLSGEMKSYKGKYFRRI